MMKRFLKTWGRKRSLSLPIKDSQASLKYQSRLTMIFIFRSKDAAKVYVIECLSALLPEDIDKLRWLFHEAEWIEEGSLEGRFIGPRREMITPFSTNAVEITQIMGISGILRLEEFRTMKSGDDYDRMLESIYENLHQDIFRMDRLPAPVEFIEDIAAYNEKAGLALRKEEIEYLEEISRSMGRKLTDSEVFGFSQVNSEHCRHKIFNGSFIIDGQRKPYTLFELIKATTQKNPNRVISAYKDNVAFLSGPQILQFSPKNPTLPDYFVLSPIASVISLKAETHNFPTTVEPFNGAATGSGGEIRDRMAGGQGSIPLAGTAVYMTSYPRTAPQRPWESYMSERKWLYHAPAQILIKASNGASDYGNKFGQPLICGSLLTFEHQTGNIIYGYDKVIMLAGGVGYANAAHSQKKHPEPGDKIVVMGGDNYRIGMGGGAVSSVDTGRYENSIELNAIQRSNPEMQKRVANALRAMCEQSDNPVVSVHDHGAGGHLNALSELVDDEGGIIYLDKLPLGDPTLSAKEIIGNESQERMGLLMKQKDIEFLEKVAQRERAPMYEVGHITGNECFIVEDSRNHQRPIDLRLEYLFGKPPRLVLEDKSKPDESEFLVYNPSLWHEYLVQVLQCEAVACKDWLTNKVDRSVTGRIAHQQTAGPLQLPLNNLGVVALDYDGITGIATAIGHAPAVGLIEPEAASRLSVAEALTNLVWAPLAYGLKGVSLSANWMWPCYNDGEFARLYRAVEAVSQFTIALGINIPTGKDSLSMTQKYPDGSKVLSPGTVIISAAAEVSNIRNVVSPVIQTVYPSYLIYIDFSSGEFHLGGSIFAQILNSVGETPPDVKDAAYFVRAFHAVQQLVEQNYIIAGHDVSAGGLIVTLLEMHFSQPDVGSRLQLDAMGEPDLIRLLFSEKPAVVVQTDKLPEVVEILDRNSLCWAIIGQLDPKREMRMLHGHHEYVMDIDELRNKWFYSSYLLDRLQSGNGKAKERFENYARMERKMKFPNDFTGRMYDLGIDSRRKSTSGIKAAIIREKGSNGEREMAYALWLAGFDVKDVHVTDLVSGRETLDEVQMIVFVGGFSNSDVLGSAKGWAGAFLYNSKARASLERFYRRHDTLSLGVCNGCQLMAELNLIYPGHEQRFEMLPNESQKFESTFLTVRIPENHSVMLSSLEGSELGIWVAHAEGRFYFPYEENCYQIAAKYSYNFFPGNPNGSMYDAAAVVSEDGRHLAIMPHLERSIFPWQWGYYPHNRKNDEVSPWMVAFVNARKWIENKNKK